MTGLSLPADGYAPVRPAIRQTVAEAIAFLRPKTTPVVDPALPRGDGQPVLVLPVIGRGDDHAAPARAALAQLGYRAFGWELGTNIGPTPRLLAGIEHRLSALHAAHGRVDIVGFSMGGVFARVLAHRHPQKIRQVITVCSPFRGTLDSAFLPLRPLLWAWRTPDLSGLAARVAQPLPVPGRDNSMISYHCIYPHLWRPRQLV